MLHGDGAPEPKLRSNAPGHRQPRHRDDVAVVEIVLKERVGAGRVRMRQQHAGAVELYVIEQPDAQLRQIGERLDVMITALGDPVGPGNAAS